MLARPNNSRLEPLLAVALVALKCWVLYSTWGTPQGFDAPHWLDVLRATHWFEPLPPPRALIASYHPPLSYLMGRLILPFLSSDVAASQVLSTLCLIGAFFALRSALRFTGILWTVPGLILLYGGFSTPLLVWLGIETGYDGPVFFWFVLAFCLSVRIFWEPISEHWWQSARFSSAVTLLGLSLAAGMLTKFNSFIALGLPLLIGFVRHGTQNFRRTVAVASLAVGMSAAIVAPLYLHRYFIPEGPRVPAAMDWQRPKDLAYARRVRDAEPIKFVLGILQPPSPKIVTSQYPVVDSFAHSIWLHLWKRDGCLGVQPDRSARISNFYILAFPIPVALGSIGFLARRRQLSDAWRDLGWVLLGIALVFCVSACAFGFHYPLWDWRVFKAKYITPAALWIPFASATWLSDTKIVEARPKFSAWTGRILLGVFLAFMVINHALPVY